MMHIIYFNPLLIIKTTIYLQTLLSVRRLDLKRHWFQSKDLKCNGLDAEIPEVKKKSVNMTINARDWQCIFSVFLCVNWSIVFYIACMQCTIVLERQREKRRESEIEKYLFFDTFFYFIVTYKGFERHTATWTNHSYLLVVLIGSLIPTSEWLFLCQNPQLLE